MTLWRWIVVPPILLLTLVFGISPVIERVQTQWCPPAGYWRTRGSAASAPQEAIDCFDRALEQDPRDHESLWRRGLNKSNLGKYEESVADLKAAISIVRKPDYLQNLGEQYLHVGDEQLALRTFDASLEVGPTNHELRKVRDELRRKLDDSTAVRQVPSVQASAQAQPATGDIQRR